MSLFRGRTTRASCRVFAALAAFIVAMACGSARAQVYFVDEDFATATGATPPAGWTSVLLAGIATDVWRFDNPDGRTLLAPLAAPAAIFDSDAYSSAGGAENVALVSPSADTTGHGVVRLKWDQMFTGGFGGAIAVEIWNGSAWMSIYATSTSQVGTQDIDVSAHAGDRAGVQVRFRWTGNYSWWWSVDNVQLYAPAPSVASITRADPDPTNAASVDFEVTFTAAVTGVDASDFALSTTGVSGASITGLSGSGASYTVSVGTGSGNGTIRLDLVDDDSIVGSMPLGGAGTGNGDFTGPVYTIDKSPAVTIDQAPAQADPAASGPITFEVTFTEAVTGFDAADVSLAGSTAGGPLTVGVTGSGASYIVTVSGMSANGTVVASIPAGAATGLVGGAPSLASTSTDNSVTLADPPPAVTIDQAPAQADPAAAGPIVFRVVFSEPVAGFTSAGVSLAGSTAPGTLLASVSGSGALYDIAVTGMTGPGVVIASLSAGAASGSLGAASLASTSTDNTVTYTGSVVTSFTGPTATGSGIVTAQFTGGGPLCSFSNPQFIAAPPGAPPVPPTAPPGGIVFPHGLFDFSTVDCAPGSTLVFTITYPGGLPNGTQYWKYGPEPGNPVPHWYVLPATVAGNVITFSITDGALGDDDLVANGTIVDQGGPGTPGGIAVPVPTMGKGSLLVLAILVLMLAGVGLRRSGAHR